MIKWLRKRWDYYWLCQAFEDSRQNRADWERHGVKGPQP